MAELMDFLPLFQESIETVRGRMDADANAGLTSSDPLWVDTREGTFYWDVTQVSALEIVRLWDALSVEVPAAAFPIFAWGEYLDNHAATFDLERKPAVPATGLVTFTGTDGTLIATGTVVSTEPADPDADPIEFSTTAPATVAGGTAVVAVQAEVSGAVGNVSAGAIVNVDSPAPTLTGVANTDGTAGGTDVESDEALRERILLEFAGTGDGNINDYKRWALSRPGVGRVFVNPVWAGPGTVQVVVMTETGDPVATGVVTDVQDYIDPTSGTADGVAPPGVTVTVQTPAPVTIAISASVSFKPGYSLDGSGGAIAQGAIIIAALSDYVNGLDVGEDVIFNHVKAQFFRASGVLDVPSLTVNSGTTDVAISVSGPTQVAQLGTPALS